jgi:hypothetical protein
MSEPLVAEFASPEELLRAARSVSRQGAKVVASFTPFRIPELDEIVPTTRTRVPALMLIAGLSMAAFSYWLQWFSAVVDYPLNVGGRPLNSWAVFLLAPFEVGMLAAALVGFATFLWECELPRLYHPIFDVPGFERASQDRFFLLAEPKGSASDLRELLENSGALSICSVPP